MMLPGSTGESLQRHLFGYLDGRIESSQSALQEMPVDECLVGQIHICQQPPILIILDLIEPQMNALTLQQRSKEANGI